MPLPQSSTISTYGAASVVNYQGLPPSDPTTTFNNTLIAPAFNDVANLTNTAPRLIVQLTLAATTGALVLGNWYSVWMNATPTVPILSRTTTGIFTITMPVNVSDQYTQSLGTPSVIPVNLTVPVGAVLSGTTPGFVNVSCSTNVITIDTFGSNGSASDLVGVVLTVSVR